MTQNLQVIHADEDESVNFIQYAPGGAFESRYVRRTSEYAIAYLSSHSGCAMSCRFCHLTATGQTSMHPASIDDFIAQLRPIFDHHSNQDIQPKRFNLNWMARGEPILNPIFHDREKWQELRGQIHDLAAQHGVDDVRFNISTIMPLDLIAEERQNLSEVLCDPKITIYYSLYSMRQAFRRRWLPKTIDPIEALRLLSQWQQDTGNDAVLHWAFIKGQNDDLETLNEIVEAVAKSGLKARFNTVRYNPFDERRGAEPSEEIIQRNFSILAEAFGVPGSRIVPRVGFSAKASCGMFVET